MKKIICFAAITLACVSCFRVNSNYIGDGKKLKGEGAVQTRDFPLSGFDSICLNGNADVKFSVADSFQVSVRTQENIFAQLDFKVEDGTLILQAKDGQNIKAEEYEITVKAPSVKAFEINGASDLDIISGIVTEDDLVFKINGAGDMSLGAITCRSLVIVCNGAADVDAKHLDVQAIDVKINGAGDVNLGGKAGDVNLTVNGAGDIDAKNLVISGKVIKKASGVASIKLP